MPSPETQEVKSPMVNPYKKPRVPEIPGDTPDNPARPQTTVPIPTTPYSPGDWKPQEIPNWEQQQPQPPVHPLQILAMLAHFMNGGFGRANQQVLQGPR